jgi:hypothetical protein
MRKTLARWTQLQVAPPSTLFEAPQAGSAEHDPGAKRTDGEEGTGVRNWVERHLVVVGSGVHEAPPSALFAANNEAEEQTRLLEARGQSLV